MPGCRDDAGAVADDDDDFDFAKTEALPADAFTGNASLDETGEVPAVAGTDVDLDLDDLTAALQISEIGDTVDSCVTTRRSSNRDRPLPTRRQKYRHGDGARGHERRPA